MNWKGVFWILFGASFGIGFGIFSGIIEELIDIGDSFLLVGGFILAILLGLLSGDKYLPFTSVLSAFMTFQVIAIHYWDTGYEIKPFWLLPLLAIVYGVPWVFLRSAKKSRKTGKKPTIVCPRCGNEIDKSWISCPYCGMKITDDTQTYDNTHDDTQTY
jgi:DNA-directed RNA polymerase subunit RPC12/RpoP